MANEVIKAMVERRSIREYKPDMVPQDKIDEIIKAGLYAASGMDFQPAIIVEVTDKKLRDRLSEMNREIGAFPEGSDPFYGAPVVLIVLAEKSRLQQRRQTRVQLSRASRPQECCRPR